MNQHSQTIMKTETCLEIQAYVDGELDAARRATVEQLCATDPEARQLSDGLTALRGTLRANEPEHVVPETREFYWSQIQRRLEVPSGVTSSPQERTPAYSAWIRWLVPLAGIAAVVALLTLPQGGSPASTSLASLTASPSATASSSSMVYRSDADGVTVHWIN